MNNQCRPMKYCLLILMFLFSCSPSAYEKDSQGILKIFEKYIERSQSPIEYREIQPFYGVGRIPAPDFLTKTEALEDIETFEYLVQTSYSGFEYWSHHGADFESYFSKLRSFVNGKDTIPIWEFETEWTKFLDLIRDGHISLIGKNRHDAYRHESAYFSEIVVEKTNDGKFQVVDSRFDGVKTGDWFTQKDRETYLFKTLSPAGKNHFLVGMLSFSPVSSQRLSFNGKTIAVPFYESRLTLAENNHAAPFHLERKNDIPVLTVTSFANEIYSVMKEFMESGRQLKNESRIIVDVMNNGGGASVFPQTFIRNLNGTASWESYWGNLKSPSIVAYYADYDLKSAAAQSPNFRNLILSSRKELAEYRRSPRKTWEFSSTSDADNPGAYKGRMIVLTNRNVVSGGEALVGFSGSIGNRLVIGENTGGVGMFSSACGYYLPHSKFIANLPRHLILIPGYEECVGFFPDYWVNAVDPLKEVLAWTADPDNYRFVYSKSFSELQKEKMPSLELPKDLNIIAPETDIPAERARYSGKWFGVSDGILDHLLVVEKIHENGDIDAVYAWGSAPRWNITPGWQRFKGKIENQKLVLTDGVATITYEYLSPVRLHATFVRPGIFSSIELTRIE